MGAIGIVLFASAARDRSVGFTFSGLGLKRLFAQKKGEA